ncbi:hypothetical protein ACGVWS_12200 [Enterobacteriaceae bacterium LUAb1]
MANFQWLPDVSQVYSDGVQSIVQDSFSKIIGKDFTMIDGELTCNALDINKEDSDWIWGEADSSATLKESNFILSNSSVLKMNGDIKNTIFSVNNAVEETGGTIVTIKLLHAALLKIDNMSRVDIKNIADVLVNFKLSHSSKFISEGCNEYNLSGNIDITEFALFNIVNAQSINVSQGTITVSGLTENEFDENLSLGCLNDFSITESADITAQLFSLVCKNKSISSISCSKFKIECIRHTGIHVSDSAELDIICDEFICEKGMGGYIELLPGKAAVTILNQTGDVRPPIDIQNKSYAEGLFRFDTKNGAEENYGKFTIQGINNAFDFTRALSENLFYINGQPVQNNQLFKAEYGGQAGSTISLLNPKQK